MADHLLLVTVRDVGHWLDFRNNLISQVQHRVDLAIRRSVGYVPELVGDSVAFHDSVNRSERSLGIRVRPFVRERFQFEIGDGQVDGESEFHITRWLIL